MNKKLINFLIEKRIDWNSLRKSRKILKNIKPTSIDADLIKKYKNKWKCFGRAPSEIYLKIYCSVSGIESENYVPENLYYGRMESVLNKKAFALAYADKNIYESYMPEYSFLFPKTYLRGINGKVYDSSYKLVSKPLMALECLENGKEYILKPASESSGGKHVLLIKIMAGEIIVGNNVFDKKGFIEYLQDKYKNNFALQERIVQHPYYADFNQSSVNTVRMFTYRSVKDEHVTPLQSVLRFGKPESLVDNQASGGLSIGISDTGLLNGFCIDKWGTKNALSDKNGKNQKNSIPGFQKMKEVACIVADKYYYHRLLGFDFCLTLNNEVKLLEINCKNIETNFLQMNNGPLFGNFTDEIINYCLCNKKSVVLDFEV